MPGVLILAYGNPLRRDDGVAWRAADAVETKFRNTEVQVVRLHQLAPELADTVKHFEVVLFVDAACIDDVEDSRAGDVRTREIHAAAADHYGPGRFSHVYSPHKVLDLAAELYHASPKAFVITVVCEDFDHGDSLSPVVAAALPELVAKISGLVEQFLPKP